MKIQNNAKYKSTNSLWSPCFGGFRTVDKFPSVNGWRLRAGYGKRWTSRVLFCPLSQRSARYFFFLVTLLASDILIYQLTSQLQLSSRLSPAALLLVNDRRYSVFICRRPRLCITLCVALTLLCSMGLFRVQVITNPDRIWVSGSVAQLNFDLWTPLRSSCYFEVPAFKTHNRCPISFSKGGNYTRVLSCFPWTRLAIKFLSFLISRILIGVQNQSPCGEHKNYLVGSPYPFWNRISSFILYLICNNHIEFQEGWPPVGLQILKRGVHRTILAWSNYL